MFKKRYITLLIYTPHLKNLFYFKVIYNEFKKGKKYSKTGGLRKNEEVFHALVEKLREKFK